MTNHGTTDFSLNPHAKTETPLAALAEGGEEVIILFKTENSGSIWL
jgi:hypothetical protein